MINKIKNRYNLFLAKRQYKFYLNLSEDKYEKELKKWYFNLTNEDLNFDDPKGFNQKIQCLKLENNPLKEVLCDKYASRKWLKDNIGEQYLVRLINCWDNFDDINFEELPDKFVLKCNHGCSFNYIVNDKKTLDKKDLKKKVRKWMNTNYAFKNGFELQYKNIVPKIICEEHLGSDFVDCQAWCANGEILFFSYIKNPHCGNEKATYNEKWERLDFVTSRPELKEKIEKPKSLDEMIDISKKISQRFKFVRVDFYILKDDSIKISEVTFTPASGGINWCPKEVNYELGEKLDISIRSDKNESDEKYN